MVNIQDLYVKQVVEFKKEEQPHSKIMRDLFGGYFPASSTPVGHWDRAPFSEDTQT